MRYSVTLNSPQVFPPRTYSFSAKYMTHLIHFLRLIESKEIMSWYVCVLLN